MNSNGWVVIERTVYRRNKNQHSFSRLLGISAAAVTQKQQGNVQLNAVYLEKISGPSGSSAEDTEEVCTKIIQSRLGEQLTSAIFCKVIVIKKQK